MGMFDSLVCEVPLPDGYDGRDFQTKCFECEMDTYTIRADGELWRRNVPWFSDDGAASSRVDFHGTVNFYTYDARGLPPLAPHDESRWHEYNAKFTDGRLAAIALVEPAPLRAAQRRKPNPSPSAVREQEA